MVSAKNPPPLCIPIPIPYIPLNTEMCVKMFNIFTPGRNLHMCMDMQMKVQKAPIIVSELDICGSSSTATIFISKKVLHFDCMRMGQDGVALVKPDQNGGLTVTDSPQGEVPDVGTVPDVETVPQSQGMQPTSVEPPQTDYDIYDEVTETKIKN